MRQYLLIAVLVSGFLISSPAHSDILGDGRPVSTVWCDSMLGVTLLVAQMRVALPDPPPGCYPHHRRPVFPTPQMLSKAELVVGPYEDFAGDIFAVFRIGSGTDAFFPFIWWGNPRFSPIGMNV